MTKAASSRDFGESSTKSNRNAKGFPVKQGSSDLTEACREHQRALRQANATAWMSLNVKHSVAGRVLHQVHQQHKSRRNLQCSAGGVSQCRRASHSNTVGLGSNFLRAKSGVASGGAAGNSPGNANGGTTLRALRRRRGSRHTGTLHSSAPQLRREGAPLGGEEVPEPEVEEDDGSTPAERLARELSREMSMRGIRQESFNLEDEDQDASDDDDDLTLALQMSKLQNQNRGRASLTMGLAYNTSSSRKLSSTSSPRNASGHQ